MAEPAANVRLSGHPAAYQIVKLASTIVIQVVIGRDDLTYVCVMPGANLKEAGRVGEVGGERWVWMQDNNVQQLRHCQGTVLAMPAAF